MKRNRALLTSAGVAGVVLAGATAVAANVGILNSADSGPIGELSAADIALASPSTITSGDAADPEVIDVYIEVPTETITTTTASRAAGGLAADAQWYAVDVAGLVAVVRTPDGIALGEVDPADGWTWTAGRSTPSGLSVEFRNGDTRYVFAADLRSDGTIEASVEQPVTRVVQGSTPPSSGSTASPGASVPASTPSVTAPSGDDDHDDDHRDDDRDDDDRHDDRDDDDEDDEDEDDEYDGRDDDD